MISSLLLAVPLALAAEPPERVSADALTPITQEMPAYPRALLGRRVPEVLTCEVAVVVEATGVPSAATASGDACPPEAAAEAEATALRWRFEPPRRVDGTVLRVATTFRMRFRQQGPETTPVAERPAASVPDCAVVVLLAGDGTVRTLRAAPEGCTVQAAAAPAPGREVPRSAACRLTLDAAYHRAVRLRFEDCAVDAQPWAAQLTRAWSWWEGPEPRTYHVTITVEP